MCHVRLCTSSGQEIANYDQCTGVDLILNDEEVPEADEHTSRDVDVIAPPNELAIDTTKDRKNK